MKKTGNEPTRACATRRAEPARLQRASGLLEPGSRRELRVAAGTGQEPLRRTAAEGGLRVQRGESGRFPLSIARLAVPEVCTAVSPSPVPPY